MKVCYSLRITHQNGKSRLGKTETVAGASFAAREVSVLGHPLPVRRVLPGDEKSNTPTLVIIEVDQSVLPFTIESLLAAGWEHLWETTKVRDCGS